MAAGVAEVTKIIGRGITEQIFSQLKGKKSKPVAASGGDPVMTQSSLSQFR
jgi:hypothetical protein